MGLALHKKALGEVIDCIHECKQQLDIIEQLSFPREEENAKKILDRVSSAMDSLDAALEWIDAMREE